MPLAENDQLKMKPFSSNAPLTDKHVASNNHLTGF